MLFVEKCFIFPTNSYELKTNNYEKQLEIRHTFRIATPIHPEATFENFIIEKRGIQDEFYFYIYSYKTVLLPDNREFTFVISIEEIEEGLINIDSLQTLFNSKMLMFSNCLYEVDDNDEPVGEPIWCFGSQGNGSGSTSGGDGGITIITNSGNSFRIVFNMDGTCNFHMTFLGDYTGDQVPMLAANVPCQNYINYFSNNNDLDEGNDIFDFNSGNDSDVNDPHFNGDFVDSNPIDFGPSGSSTSSSSGNTSTVAILPFVPYDQQIIKCFVTFCETYLPIGLACFSKLHIENNLDTVKL